MSFKVIWGKQTHTNTFIKYSFRHSDEYHEHAYLPFRKSYLVPSVFYTPSSYRIIIKKIKMKLKSPFRKKEKYPRTITIDFNAF